MKMDEYQLFHRLPGSGRPIYTKQEKTCLQNSAVLRLGRVWTLLLNKLADSMHNQCVLVIESNGMPVDYKLVIF